MQIATLHLPKRDAEAGSLDGTDYDDERGGERSPHHLSAQIDNATFFIHEELGGYTSTLPKISITQRINHPGEVNRARYMPQNPDLIATKTVSGEVLIFDRTKHSDEPEKGGVCNPDMRLVGQGKEGYTSDQSTLSSLLI